MCFPIFLALLLWSILCAWCTDAADDSQWFEEEEWQQCDDWWEDFASGDWWWAIRSPHPLVGLAFRMPYFSRWRDEEGNWVNTGYWPSQSHTE